jgi:hypothetical protein
MEHPSARPAEPDDVVDVSYRRTAQDVKDVLLTQRRARPGVLVRLLSIPAVMALAAVLLPSDRALLLGSAAVVALFFVFVPWIGPRLRPARWGVGPVHHVVFTPAGFRQEGPVIGTTVPWSQVDRLVPGRSGVILLRRDRPQLIVPRRRIDDADLARVTAWWTAARQHPVEAGVAPEPAPPAPAPARTPAAAPAVEPAVEPAVDSLTELPDGTLVVRGRLTPERAKVIAGSLTSPLVPIGMGLLIVGGVISLLQGNRVPAAVDAVLLVWLGWVALSAPGRAARGLVRFAGPGEVTWTYTPEGMGITAEGGHTDLPWSRVRTARLRGDLLVIRARGVRWATGGPVGPLTPDQLERVRGWARAARQTGRPASRMAG